MGASSSKPYKYLKHMYYNYNAEFRAHKMLDREKLPPAPRHKAVKEPNPEVVEKLKTEMEELSKKDPNLNEYLKKVYLTSTGEMPKFDTSKPLPVKREYSSKMFYDMVEPKPGYLTLTQFATLLKNHSEQTVSVDSAVEKFNLDKKTIVNLLTYYSLFKRENFAFMNVREKEDKVEEKKEIEYEVFSRLEKKPLKQIEGK